MKKPSGEDLLPEYMQATTDFALAAAVYFGLHAMTAYMLLRDYGHPFAFMPSYYVYVLSSVIKAQNLFYLIHLLPALCVRYFLRERASVRLALCTALMICLTALIAAYPVSSLIDPGNLKNILRYFSLVPFLMTFYTLRIHRLQFSGGLVIAIFIVLLALGVLYARV